jgi:hypothetical protein
MREKTQMVCLKIKTKKQLDKKKIIPRQTYDEVIQKILYSSESKNL